VYSLTAQAKNTFYKNNLTLKVIFDFREVITAEEEHKSMNLTPKKPAFLGKKSNTKKEDSKKKNKPASVEENLRPESRVVKAVNKASKKASEVGSVEVSTPTPREGLLGKRVNPLGPIKWLLRYVRDSYRELKKVTWPDKKTAWKLTGTVFLFSFIMAMFLFGLDSIFSEMFKKLFLKD